MRLITPLFRSIACVLILLSLAACAVPTAAAPTTPPVATATSSASATNIPLTVTPAATTVPSTAATATSAPLITAQNASTLTAAHLTLPDWPMRFLWVPAGFQVPGAASAPDILAQTEKGFTPIHLNPSARFSAPALDPPLQMNLPGSIVAIAPSLTSLVVRAENGPFSIVDLSGTVLQKVDEPNPYGAAYSPDSKFLAVTTQNVMSVVIYDLATGKQVTRLTGFQTAAPVYDAGILPGNSTVFWHARATLRFQDIQTGEMGKEINFTDFINQMVFSADGTRMAVAVGQQLFLEKVPTGEQIAQISLSKPINSLSLSPDDRLLAAGYGPDIQFWDAATLAPVASLPGPNDFSGLVSFSPDGKSLVSLHTGNVVNIWKAGP